MPGRGLNDRVHLNPQCPFVQGNDHRITDSAHIIETGSDSYPFRKTPEKRKGRAPVMSPSTAPSLAAENEKK